MMTPIRHPVILDFDDSLSLLNMAKIQLDSWQEKIRFSSNWRALDSLSQYLKPQLPKRLGCVFLGSGDYHHITYLLLHQLKHIDAFDIVVCDNHPDNMRYPFGLHCGSWVYWASKLSFVNQIHVLGITSNDISWQSSWCNYLTPLLRKKVVYWSLNVDTRWMNICRAGYANRNFTCVEDLLEQFCSTRDRERPVYLSIDKDVLSRETIMTNWDQGIFTEDHLKLLIEHLTGKIIGVDITGEVSDYQYYSRSKRFLSSLDGQKAVEKERLAAWQQAHHRLNERLLAYLEPCWCD